jgi:hypothetical protein
MRCLIVVFSLFIIFYVDGDRHLNANGPFGKRHIIGDEPSPHACNPLVIPSSSRALTVMNINISSNVYSSNELINISWTPISDVCVDDFVGIYFVDIPLEKGK